MERRLVQREDVAELAGIPLVKAQEALIDYLVEVRDSVLQEAEADPNPPEYATQTGIDTDVDTG
jgi:hypothetical protein